MIYVIWQSIRRNDVLWNKKFPIVIQFANMLKNVIRMRILAILPKKLASANKNWFLSLLGLGLLCELC